MNRNHTIETERKCVLSCLITECLCLQTTITSPVCVSLGNHSVIVHGFVPVHAPEGSTHQSEYTAKLLK